MAKQLKTAVILPASSPRYLSTAKVNAAHVSGIQVGKPFIEKLNGWPLDFAGFVGLTHHDQRGLQANGL